MDKSVGMWVDHKRAYLVQIVDSEESAKEIRAEHEDIEVPQGKTKSPTGFGLQEFSQEKTIQQRRKAELREYYHRIMAELKSASRIYIFGPGEAKNELVKEMQRTNGIAARIVAVEPADKMTTNQIAAKVRQRFIRKTIPGMM
jgi:hypothetical protein